MQNVRFPFGSHNLVKVSNIYNTNIVNVLQSSNIYIAVAWFHL